jgi:hypothetical protein
MNGLLPGQPLGHSFSPKPEVGHSIRGPEHRGSDLRFPPDRMRLHPCIMRRWAGLGVQHTPFSRVCPRWPRDEAGRHPLSSPLGPNARPGLHSYCVFLAFLVSIGLAGYKRLINSS